MRMMASKITSLTIVYSAVYSGANKKTSKLRVTGLGEGNSPVTGEFPAQRASDAENVSIWWRHHVSIARSAQLSNWLEPRWYFKDTVSSHAIPMDNNAVGDKDLKLGLGWMIISHIWRWPELDHEGTPPSMFNITLQYRGRRTNEN